MVYILLILHFFFKMVHEFFFVLSRCEAGASMLNEADPLLLPEVKASASGANGDDGYEERRSWGSSKLLTDWRKLQIR